MTLMADIIQTAGYFPDPTTNKLSSTLLASGSFANSQAITGAAGDSISVRYMTAPLDNILNCSGLSNITGGNVVYVNTFAVVPGVPSGQLVCTDQTGTAYPLVGGVTNLTVLYGVKTDLAAAGNNADTYLTTSQMTASTWQNVISVWIKLQFTNPLYTGPNQGQTQTITVQRVVDVMNQTGPST
jgi:type IV pilus assembly protein PilW